MAGGAILINESGQQIDQWAKWQSMPEFDLTLFLKGYPFLISTVLIRRSAFDKLDYWFDPTLERAEDSDFFNRLTLANCRMAWKPEWVAYYRQHPANSQEDALSTLQAKIKVLDKVFNSSQLPAAV